MSENESLHLVWQNKYEKCSTSKGYKKEKENVPFIFANDITFVAVGKVSLSCYKKRDSFLEFQNSIRIIKSNS